MGTDLTTGISFEEALEKGMSWTDIIRHFEPTASDEKCLEIYEKVKASAYKIAVIGRREFLTQNMIFDCITQHYWHLIIK